MEPQHRGEANYLLSPPRGRTLILVTDHEEIWKSLCWIQGSTKQEPYRGGRSARAFLSLGARQALRALQCILGGCPRLGEAGVLAASTSAVPPVLARSAAGIANI